MKSGDHYGVEPFPALDLLHASPNQKLPALPEGAAAVRCVRSSIVPAENDWLTLMVYQKPLLILTGKQVSALEIVNGRLDYAVPAGAATPVEMTQIQAWLSAAQVRFYRKPNE